MKIYLVGGAVRDKLMGLPVNDRDYVVVGSTVEKMLSLGYQQVGADFPVFLHPETREEYALARQERKTGRGYLGFEAVFDENTTLEDDLRRRDLTINAMAQDLDTLEIVDPFGGQQDLKSGTLKHTSEAFSEDPVRVLRLARFHAKYFDIGVHGFSVDNGTVYLARELCNSGELNFLTSERIFKEFEKALSSKNSHVFINSLAMLGALKVVAPEIQALHNVPAGPTKYHSEGSTLAHTRMVMREAEKYNNPLVTFGALVHDLGKALTPQDKFPSHPGHEEAGVPLVEAFCNRLKMPTQYKRVGMLVTRHHGHVHKTFEMSAKSFVRIYKDFNRGHFDHDVDVLVKVAEADHWGRVSVDNPRELGYPEADKFKAVLTAIHKVKLSDAFSIEQIKEMSPELIQQRFHQLRCSAAKQQLNLNKRDRK